MTGPIDVGRLTERALLFQPIVDGDLTTYQAAGELWGSVELRSHNLSRERAPAALQQQLRLIIRRHDALAPGWRLSLQALMWEVDAITIDEPSSGFMALTCREAQDP